ncbi:MAG TPA: PaaI family thioesterase [Acidobacteriota bacterium]|nr:PaaI family thioesterase [Acidobacteriota bacterium]HQF85840.1 PaaI family thioesterase [Acidobacteriota bacterium]HQG90916.1 PaaI family thioesterase [Acidobacteriota bacterium]HQK88942.1 PaaI family thioesterase [Acidobacteriota bacterium]
MERDRFCFCCGTDNPHGLQLRIAHDESTGRVFTECALAERYQGYRGTVHGGLLATLLDELMAHAALRVAGGHAATARMEVAFRRPVPVGEPLRVEAEADKVSGRRIQTRGWIVNSRGERLAEASALFLAVPADGSPKPVMR